MVLCWDTERINISSSLWILVHGVLWPMVTLGRLALDHEPLVHVSPCWISHWSSVHTRAVILLNTAWPQLPQMSNRCLKIPAIGFICTAAGSVCRYALGLIHLAASAAAWRYVCSLLPKLHWLRARVSSWPWSLYPCIFIGHVAGQHGHIHCTEVIVWFAE